MTLFLYHIQIKHQRTANDEKTRLDICNFFNDKMEENLEWIEKVWFSDEAQFYLDDYVNSKNNIFLGTAPPQKVLQRLLHSSKVTARCAMNSKTMIEPNWFEDEGGKSVISKSGKLPRHHPQVLLISQSPASDYYEPFARRCYSSHCQCNTEIVEAKI